MTKDASSLARNTAPAAISDGSPRRPKGGRVGVRLLFTWPLTEETIIRGWSGDIVLAGYYLWRDRLRGPSPG